MGNQEGRLDRIVRTPALPIIAGVISVLSLFSSYTHRVGWRELPVPLVVATLWSIIIWGALYYTPYIKRITRKESGLIATALVLVTMAWMEFPSSLIATSVAWTLLVLIALSKPKLQLWFNRIGVAWLVATFVVVIIWAGIASLQADRDDYSTGINTGRGDNLPNIYIVIPDRFTSIDGLRVFGDEPGSFVKELKGRGFYIREDAMSEDLITPGAEHVPTTRTLRFLASLLNNGEVVPLDISYNDASRLVKNSTTIRELKGLGYKYHNIGSWFIETKALALADYNYSYKGYDLMSLMYGNEFSVAVLDRCILRELDTSPLLRFSDYNVRRSEHTYQKDMILDIAGHKESPKFVLAHLILPHPPFVWAADGGLMPAGLTNSEQYIEQVNYTKGFLLEIADGILARDSDAIIIIQSDEGCLFTHPPDNKGLTDTQWNGVLTAWRIPSQEDTDLENICVVNILGYVKSIVTGQMHGKD